MRILTVILGMLALAACNGPVAQVGDPRQPAAVNAPVCMPVSIAAEIPVSMPVSAPISVGPIAVSCPVSAPVNLNVASGAFTADVQVGPREWPLVELSNPVTVNLPDLTRPVLYLAVIVASAVILATLLHVLAGHVLAKRRERR